MMTRENKPAIAILVADCFLALFTAGLLLFGLRQASAARPAAAPTSTIYHVAKSGDGSDGLSWTTAFTDLQHALALAGSGNEVWVAQGVYTPGLATTDSFHLRAGIALYGGFAATETVRAERNWTANPTVLSGDIAGDDPTTPAGVVTNTDLIVPPNSAHVITLSGKPTPITADTVVDGFYITAGFVTSSAAIWHGSGMLCNGTGGKCSPSLSNLTFSGNFAYGGALANLATEEGSSSPSLYNVTFSNNTAEAGAAMFNKGNYDGSSSPTLNIVWFLRNRADYGGAMLNDGGAGRSNPILNHVIFAENTGRYGGAMYNVGRSGEANPVLNNVEFISNTAVGMPHPFPSGGAIFNDGASPILNNVTLFGNSADFGGAIFNSIRFGGISQPELNNAILWGNNAVTAGNEIYNDNSLTVIGTSLVSGGVTGTGVVNVNGGGVVDQGGNINANPIFVNPAGGDLHLHPSSPAVDSGNMAACPAVDIRGVSRPQGGGCDMGAYETWLFHIAALPPTDLMLSWDPAAPGCAYDVFESTTPYTVPAVPAYPSVTSSLLVPGRLGDVTTNYYFTARATCGGELVLYSPQVGEIDYALVPGN